MLGFEEEAMAGMPQDQMPPGMNPDEGGADTNLMIEQAIDMLMRGAEPEELLERGFPPEIIQAAIQVIMADAGEPIGGEMIPQAGPEDMMMG